MFWRRISGAIVMGFGASLAIAAAILAAIVIANYVEWANATEALGTVAMVTVPPFIVGGLLLVFGRLVYGEWNERAPVMRIAALIAQFAGAFMALLLGAMFLFLVFSGIGPGDRQAAVALGLGMIGGFAIAFFGWTLKPSRRRHGKYFD